MRIQFAFSQWNACVAISTVCIAVVLLFPVLTNTHIFPFQGDAACEYPYAIHTIRSLVYAHDFPLWDPFSNCGQPFYYNHAWLGTFNFLRLLTARLIPFFPGTDPSKIILAVTIAGFVLLVWAFFHFVRQWVPSHTLTLLATLHFGALCRDLFRGTDQTWTAFGMYPIFYCWERWLRTWQRRYFWGVAVSAGIYASFANICITDSLFVIIAYLSVRLPALLRFRLAPNHAAAFARSCFGAVLLLLIIISPKILIALDASGNVCRIPTSLAHHSPNIARGGMHSLLEYLTLAAPEWHNVLLIFVPFAAFERRNRPLLLLLLLLLYPSIFPSQYLVLWDYFFPFFANSGHVPDLSIFERNFFLLITILGACGAQVIIRFGVPRGRGAGNALRIFCFCLWSALLFSGKPVAALLPGLLYLILLWPAREVTPLRRAWPIWIAIFVSVAWAFWFFPYSGFSLATHVFKLRLSDFVHRGVRAPLAVDADMHGSTPFARQLLAQELSAGGQKWRTAAYDRLLRLSGSDMHNLVRTGLPVAYLANNVLLADNDTDMIHLIATAPSANIAVIVSSDSHQIPKSFALPATGSYANVIAFAPHGVDLEVYSTCPALLVYADSYDPRWSATRGFQPASILRVNGLFKGIVVPAGSTRVTMRYRYPLLTYLLWVSTYLQLIFVPFLIFLPAWQRPADRQHP